MNFFHAALLELEHGVRIAFGNEFVRFLIVVADLVEIDGAARVFQNVIARLFDIGQRRERQKVHFQHTDGFDFFHVELGSDILAVARKRNVVRDRLAADDYARACMEVFRGMPSSFSAISMTRCALRPFHTIQ